MPQNAQILHFPVRYILDRVLSLSHIIVSNPNMLFEKDKQLYIYYGSVPCSMNSEKHHGNISWQICI